MEVSVPTYISLLRYTQQGIGSVKEGPKRLDAAKEAYKKVGGELKAFYLTMGQYDMVTIAEFPNDEVAARAALSLGAAGNIRSESFRAFTEAEYRKIISSL
jgi:uncharacterized protein with GYD domain